MIKIPAAGGYDQLVYTDLPECGYTEGANIKLDGHDETNCVVVETHACGVNYADVIIRWGLYESAKKYVGWPITPGFEFSGTIKKIGENVKDFKVGDKVAGVSMFGGYSQKIFVPANQIQKIPDNISMSEAAGFIAVGLTAWYAIFELCKLRKGDSVLIHSAAGGVGSMLVQMTKNIIGCHVVGVVGRSHKVDIAKELGCDSVIDKSTQDLWTTAEDLTVSGYKAIFDANGVDTLQESYKHVASGGRLVSFGGATLMPRSTATGTGSVRVSDWIKMMWRYKNSPTFNPLTMMSDNKSLMAFNLSFMFADKTLIKESFNDLFQWIEDGRIKVAKVTEYRLKDVGTAHRDLESGNTIGKLVLLTQEESKETTKEQAQNDDAESHGLLKQESEQMQQLNIAE